MTLRKQFWKSLTYYWNCRHLLRIRRWVVWRPAHCPSFQAYTGFLMAGCFERWLKAPHSSLTLLIRLLGSFFLDVGTSDFKLQVCGRLMDYKVPLVLIQQRIRSKKGASEDTHRASILPLLPRSFTHDWNGQQRWVLRLGSQRNRKRIDCDCLSFGSHRLSLCTTLT